jgi:hypothetical protein
VEALKGWDGDKDDNRLLAVANFNLNNDQSQHAISMFYKNNGPQPVRFHNWDASTHPRQQYLHV